MNDEQLLSAHGDNGVQTFQPCDRSLIESLKMFVGGGTEKGKYVQVDRGISI